MPSRAAMLVFILALLVTGQPDGALAGVPRFRPAAPRVVAKPPLRDRVRWRVNRMLGKGRSLSMSKLTPDSAAAKDGLTHRAHGGVDVFGVLGEVARVARSTGETVVIQINGRRVTASPSHTRADLIITYLGGESVPKELKARTATGALPMRFGGGVDIIEEIAPAMIAEANRVQRPVTSKINGRQVVVHPNDIPYFALVQVYGEP